jgi:hypothetical protein
MEVEELLHTGDVRIGALDDQAGGGLDLGGVGDIAVDDDHLLLGGVPFLHLDDAGVLFAGHRLVATVLLRRVSDDVGGGRAPGVDAGEDVVVAEDGGLSVLHLAGELAEVLVGGIVDERPGLDAV